MTRNRTFLQDSNHTDSRAAKDAARQTLDELTAGYIKRLPGKLDAIRLATRSLLGEANTRHALSELQTLVHKLSGSAGAYDCSAVGTAARTYENLIESCLDSGAEPDSATLDQFAQNLARLESAISLRLSEYTTPRPESTK